MSLKLTAPQPAFDSEICFSYFVKGSTGKPSRVGRAKVLDISETGLCMEISPLDSDLFMESFCGSPSVNRDMDLQIFCRSHPKNIFVEGSVRWFKQKEEIDSSGDLQDSLDICAGVVFSIDDIDKKREIRQMLGRMDNPITRCRACGAPVSIDGSFCYECGSRLIGRREALRIALYDTLVHEAAGAEG